MKIHRPILAIAAALACMFTSAAQAGLMLDFDDNAAGIVTQSGYTSVTTAGGAILSDIGIGGSVSISFASDGSIDDRKRGAMDGSQPLGDLGRDFIFGIGGAGATYLDVTISGIKAGTYVFTGYYHEINNGGGNATIDVDFDTGSGLVDGATVARTSGTNPAGGLATGVFSFTSDGINPLRVRTVSNVNGHLINGLDVAAAVPEPSTLILTTLGLLCLGMTRRRRRC